MRKGLLQAILLVLITLPRVINAQICSTYTGQTVAFTLAAGAKAAWDQGSTVVLQRQVQWQKGSSFSVHQSSTGDIVFKIAGFSMAVNVRISLFTIDGRCVETAAMHGQTSGTFCKTLPPGIYLARCEADGAIVRTARFIAGGQP